VKLRRFLAALLIALPLLVALLLGVAWLPVREAREAWLSGHNGEAIAIAQQWSRLNLWRRQYHQIFALSYLSAGNETAARPHLAAIGEGWLPAIDKGRAADHLFAIGKEAAFLEYDAASHDRRESADTPLYRAAALTGVNRLNDASTTLRGIDAAKVDGRKYAALRAAIEQRLRGSAPFVFDRENRPIGVYRPASNDVAAIDPDFDALIDREAGDLTIGARLSHFGSSATIATTLDPFVQKAALKALAGYRGSLVAIDPRTNEILAIANARGKGPLTNLAIEHQYEPGSVIKVLTGLNALASGVDVNSMFPYVCKGELMIDGRRFGDWMPQGHGRLANIDEALAVSCNVVFADIGMRLGHDRLQRFMNSTGFDGQANLGIFQAPLGRTTGGVSNNFETAFFAIGLQHETIDTIHLAMLAAMIANRGVLTTPRLLRERRSILGEVTAVGPRQGKTQIASPAAVERIIAAMQQVITNPRGTGRRAEIAGLNVAMKTGTAGERSSGLEALIMAFAPAESPKIAFGIIAEDAGPAEFAGAKIARDFLEEMKSRM
jgi:hypothetical protein